MSKAHLVVKHSPQQASATDSQLDSNPDHRWVVVATRTPWDEAPRIRHQIARGLAKHYSVLYIHFPSDWRRKRRTRWRDVEPGILVWEPSNWLTVPDCIRARCSAAGWPERLYFRCALSRWLRRLHERPIALINFDHRHCWIQNHEYFPRIVYLCNDDFPAQIAFAGNMRLSRWTSGKIQQASSLADVSLATSEHIAQEVIQTGKARVFSPGHDLPPSSLGTESKAQDGRPIRVGFMGYITRNMAIDWVERVAREADMEWHMVGPVLNLEIYAHLRSLGVNFYETRKGGELLSWLQSMDVLTMPYALPPVLARAGMPNKTYAYFAAGRPVVALAGLPIPDYGPGIVYRASDPEEFLAQVRHACLEDDTIKTTKRLEIASRNTWETRIIELRALLEATEL